MADCWFCRSNRFSFAVYHAAVGRFKTYILFLISRWLKSTDPSSSHSCNFARRCTRLIMSLVVFSYITACVNLPISRGQIFVEFITKTRFNGMPYEIQTATKFIRCVTICIRLSCVSRSTYRYIFTSVPRYCQPQMRAICAVDGHAMIKLEVNSEANRSRWKSVPYERFIYRRRWILLNNLLHN